MYDASVNKLAETNVRGLAALCAKDSNFREAEEFHCAGKDYQVPQKLRRSFLSTAAKLRGVRISGNQL